MAWGTDIMTAEASVHASCVAIGRSGVLILGPSGSGKSSLALGLMAMGAELVADDRVQLRCHGDDIWAYAPPHSAGWIEARGMGLLRSTGPLAKTPLMLAVTLGQDQQARLPQPDWFDHGGIMIPNINRQFVDHNLIAVVSMILQGRLVWDSGEIL